MAGVGVDHTRTHSLTHLHTHTANMTTITRQFLIIYTIILRTKVTAFDLNTTCYQRLTRKEATSSVSTSQTCSCGQALRLTTEMLQRSHDLSLSPSPCTPNSKHILPSTTAIFSYAIGSWKLSANEQFFVGAQTVVHLLQTTQNNACHL